MQNKKIIVEKAQPGMISKNIRKEIKPHSYENRNMLAGIVHGAFFNMAQAFAEPYALLPIFLAGFTSSRLIVGLIVGSMQAATVVPQLPISRLLRRHPLTAKPLMLWGIWTRCIVWGILGIFAILNSGQTTLLLFVSIALISLYSFGGGVAVLPFNRIISETIPPQRRSSFYGWRLFFGSLMAMTAGYFVKVILENSKIVWPKNFGVLFLISFVTLIIAYTAMSMFKFPKDLPGKYSDNNESIWRQCLKAFRVYPVMKRFISIQLLTSKLALFMPFLTLYATKGQHIPLKWVGVFIICIKLGTMLSNLLWVPIGNKIGTRILIRSGIIIGLASIVLNIFAHNVVFFSIAFFATGFASSALRIGYSAYILEIGPPEVRILLVAIRGTMILPLYFMPLLGGWIIDSMGYFWLLIIALVFFSFAFIMSLTLCEPRQGSKACGPSTSKEFV